ncbi:Dipeptidyl peptidase 2 [Phytophthora pseudosyringae]|uniref:Dipeptidyl peptidase 2 n=1 Tax=Phytophthora pseudosyringae TaxID=221518 RepID=A0A8T1VW99_9STRA|nr:Dipeptidyl peptidase 2 [Phytophthora pseudosyringae]
MQQATYDTWQRAHSVEHFHKLARGERRLQNHALGRLCVRSLRLFKQLPNSPVTWLYLVILGSLAAIYGLLFDGWVRALFALRRHMVEAVGEYSFGAFILWTMWCVGLGMLATCCGYFISPASDGSGIPTMRGLFAGVFQNPGDTLSFRTLVARSLGTVLASGSGLSVGRAGPFTHIMSIIGYLMGKISIFQRVDYGQQNYNFIRAAVACGMTASFGSPLGGVLFGIEVTAKYYEIKCLWEGIICSSFCILVFHIITFTKNEVLFERTNFTGFDIDTELFAFVLLGVITGIGAGLYCKLALVLRNVQARLFERFNLTKPSIQRRAFHVVSICLATAILTFPFGIMRLSDRVMVNELFRDQALSFPQWTQFTDSKHTALVVYFILKLVISVLPCGAPFSCGVFGPLFTMGAAVGRFYGETLMEVWNPNQSPATYAVVGAACFAASATQTVSTAVIFFELTGQLSHMVPVMIACIAAYFVSGMITPSIYDILASWAGMNSVCYDFNEHVLSQKAAKDYMGSVPVVFTRDTTYDEAIQALNTFKKEEYFPLCDNADKKLLLVRVADAFDATIWKLGLLDSLQSTAAGYTLLLKEDAKNPKVSERIQDLISQVLDIDKKKSATVEDVSLLNCQPKDASSTSSMLELGPPFDEYEFTSIPVESYPPQVGEDVNLYRVHKLASISSWTQVYVVKFGKLQGVIHLDSSLTKLRKEEPPIRFS